MIFQARTTIKLFNILFNILLFISIFILVTETSSLVDKQSKVELYLPVTTTTPYGIWLSTEEIAALPTSGSAWEALLDEANQSAGTPDLSDQDDDTNVIILAKALAYARIGDANYLNDVLSALQVITFDDTEDGGRTLALGRELAAYIIAADLINLAMVDPQLDGQFRDKLQELLTKELDGRTLQNTHEDRANNWGTHAGASRAAIAVYLDDTVELERTAEVFKGWLGDRDSYADFGYSSDDSWQCDPEQPVGINPVGCSKEGHSIDGALPEEMRRGGSFTWPPDPTGYAWEGLQGAIVQAHILYRAGYPTWDWEDQALLRAVQFLYDVNWPADGDDEWQLWLINYVYGTSYPTTTPAGVGKNMGWTDWTHAAHPPNAPIVTAAIGPTSDDLQLEWFHVTQNVMNQPITVDHYVIWRCVEPFFQPNDSAASQIATVTPPSDSDETSLISLVDSGIVSDATPYYYLIQTMGPTNQASEKSNPVGLFSLSLE